jgi:sulfur carrier protein
MKITVNGKATEIPEDPSRTVASLLEELQVTQRLYVSVELNGEILPREGFPATAVKDGDAVEFLYFMGGGK